MSVYIARMDLYCVLRSVFCVMCSVCCVLCTVCCALCTVGPREPTTSAIISTTHISNATMAFPFPTTSTAHSARTNLVRNSSRRSMGASALRIIKKSRNGTRKRHACCVVCILDVCGAPCVLCSLGCRLQVIVIDYRHLYSSPPAFSFQTRRARPSKTYRLKSRVLCFPFLLFMYTFYFTSLGNFFFCPARV